MHREISPALRHVIYMWTIFDVPGFIIVALERKKCYNYTLENCGSVKIKKGDTMYNQSNAQIMLQIQSVPQEKRK